MTRFESDALRILLYMKEKELRERLETEQDETNRAVITRMLEGLKMYSNATIMLDL